jgi:hypothetical protein
MRIHMSTILLVVMLVLAVGIVAADILQPDDVADALVRELTR